MDQFLSQVETLNIEILTFKGLVDILKSLGTLLLKMDPTTTEIMFESLVLPQMVDIIAAYYNKREKICQIIFNFCLVTSSSRQRFLKKIKEHLSQNLKLFIAVLSIVVSLDSEEDFTEELYNLYFYFAIVSLDFPSPVTRSQGLKILNEIAYINYVPVIQIICKLFYYIILIIHKRSLKISRVINGGRLRL